MSIHILQPKGAGLTDLQIVEAFEEAARAADQAKGPKEFPALSANMVIRLCAIARLGQAYAVALRDIKLRADSDASCEELEDAQADLRYIHARATVALCPSEGKK